MSMPAMAAVECRDFALFQRSGLGSSMFVRRSPSRAVRLGFWRMLDLAVSVVPECASAPSPHERPRRVQLARTRWNSPSSSWTHPPAHPLDVEPDDMPLDACQVKCVDFVPCHQSSVVCLRGS